MLLHSYIRNKFIKFYAISFFALVGILWLTKMITFLDFITEKNMPLLDFFTLTVLLIPRLVEFLIPITILIALVITFHYFLYSKEIFIFKISGIKNKSMLRILLPVILFLIFLNFLILFYITPFSSNKIENIKLSLSNKVIASVLSEGEFKEIAKGVTVFVKSKKEIFYMIFG